MIITFSGARRGVNLSWVLRKDRAEREGAKKCMVDKAVPPRCPPSPPPRKSSWRLWLSSREMPLGKSWADSVDLVGQTLAQGAGILGPDGGNALVSLPKRQWIGVTGGLCLLILQEHSLRYLQSLISKLPILPKI